MIQRAPGAKRKINWRENGFAYALLLPSLVFLALFTFYPTIKSVYVSFYSSNLSERKFVGFDQYVQVFQDDVFMKALANNLLLVLALCR